MRVRLDQHYSRENPSLNRNDLSFIDRGRDRDRHRRRGRKEAVQTRIAFNRRLILKPTAIPIPTPTPMDFGCGYASPRESAVRILWNRGQGSFQLVEIVEGDQGVSFGCQNHEVQMCWRPGRRGIRSGPSDGSDRRAGFAESARPDINLIQVGKIEYLIVQRIQSPHISAAPDF